VSPDPQVEGSFKFVTHINTAEAGEIEDFLETAVLDNCEGLMIKSLDTPNAIYVPDKRYLHTPNAIDVPARCVSHKGKTFVVYHKGLSFVGHATRR